VRKPKGHPRKQSARIKRSNSSDETPSRSATTKPGSTPRILYVDLETSPNIADVWGLWDQNVGLVQLKQSARVIGFGAKWAGQKSVKWYGEYDPKTGANTHAEMVVSAHRLYDQADIVVTYNGDRFDHLHFNAEWVSAGLTPPSPVQSIDLYKVVKKEFRFPSNKLQYVANRLLGDSKVPHSGHALWNQCLDPHVSDEDRRKGWAMMAKYCRQDVALLEPLHERLKPWLPAKVNMSLFDGPGLGCKKCGGRDLEARGTAYTATRAFPQYRCRCCGGWTRDSRSSWSVTK
jgi:hypothetical protein